MQRQPAWFQKLFAYVEYGDSCNPDLADIPSFPNFAKRSVEDTSSSAEEHEGRAYAVPRNKKRDCMFQSIQRRRWKETPSQLLEEAVQNCNNLASQDPTDALVAFFKEENEKCRAHEREMMMVPGQARPSFPSQIENHYNHHGAISKDWRTLKNFAMLEARGALQIRAGSHFWILLLTISFLDKKLNRDRQYDWFMILESAIGSVQAIIIFCCMSTLNVHFVREYKPESVESHRTKIQ